MWVGSRDRSDASKFEFTVYDLNGEEYETRGGFENCQERDRAAELSQRYCFFGEKPLEAPTMTINEILAELDDYYAT